MAVHAGREGPATMTLGNGIRAALRARGLLRRELVQRVPRDAGRWAIYRVLSERSTDPRLSTFVLLCQALDVSPTELLQLSGMWPQATRGDTAGDVELREAFRAIQSLEPGSRELATQLLHAVSGALDRAAQGRGGASELPVAQ